MSYIGNSPTQSAFVTDLFNGDNSTTAFTMSVSPANPASILVAVSGVLQSPDTYSISGRTLNFSAAPPSATGNISVRYLGIPASGVTTTAYRTLTEYTATAGQTTFTPPSYTVGFINVFRNGVMLGTADYTASNGTSVVLANACSSGDLVVVESFYVSSVLNAIPATANSIIDLYVNQVTASKLIGSQSIPKTTLPIGSVLQVVSSPKTDSFTTTSGSYVDITGLSVSITPTSSSSKILVMFSVNAGIPGDVMHGYLTLIRGSTEIFKADTAGSRRSATAVVNTATQQQFTYAGMYLDSPATTSATTYKIQALSSNGNSFAINRSARDTDLLAYDGRSVSSITVMEIAA